MIDTGNSCTRSETKLNWNQQGPQGPPSAVPFTVMLACNSYYDGQFLSDVHMTAIEAQSIVNH